LNFSIAYLSIVLGMSFANQFLSMVRLSEEGKDLSVGVHDIPVEQDQMIAGIKLSTMGMNMDTLTQEQIDYDSDYSAGT